MFTSTISKIWLVGLFFFALTPFLMSRTSTANDHMPAAEKTIEAPEKSAIEAVKLTDDRDPASEIKETALAK